MLTLPKIKNSIKYVVIRLWVIGLFVIFMYGLYLIDSTKAETYIRKQTKYHPALALPKAVRPSESIYQDKKMTVVRMKRWMIWYDVSFTLNDTYTIYGAPTLIIPISKKTPEEMAVPSDYENDQIDKDMYYVNLSNTFIIMERDKYIHYRLINTTHYDSKTQLWMEGNVLFVYDNIYIKPPDETAPDRNVRKQRGFYCITFDRIKQENDVLAWWMNNVTREELGEFLSSKKCATSMETIAWFMYGWKIYNDREFKKAWTYLIYNKNDYYGAIQNRD